MVDGHSMRLRIHEEGVHARGLWEEQVARFADVADDSPLRQEAPLPAGQYDAGATGRLKLELRWGEWWTRQQTRWADTAAVRLEDRLREVLDEADRRAGAAVPGVGSGFMADVPAPFSVPGPGDGAAASLPADALTLGTPYTPPPYTLAPPVDVDVPYAESAAIDLGAEPLEEHFGAVLDDEAQRWEQAERVRRYLDAMERAHGENLETAEWIAWGRTYADRLDPLHRLKAPPRRPPAPPVA